MEETATVSNSQSKPEEYSPEDLDNICEMILGFNLGIEIGQIIIALTVLLTLFIMKRMMNNANLHSFRNILSASLASIGAYWFLIRSII